MGSLVNTLSKISLIGHVLFQEHKMNEIINTFLLVGDNVINTFKTVRIYL